MKTRAEISKSKNQKRGREKSLNKAGSTDLRESVGRLYTIRLSTDKSDKFLERQRCSFTQTETGHWNK